MTTTTNGHHRDISDVTQGRTPQPTAIQADEARGPGTAVQEGTEGVQRTVTVSRGLTDSVPTSKLRSSIWRRSLRLANRFRVVRTLDIAVSCFPERDYKAALTAAQRATRGLVKADLLKRYRTNRFQTVYGLTQRGAEWLHELDEEAAASVRRVSDMSNPEHRLWGQFLVLAAEARGLTAWSEAELLQRLACKPRGGKGMEQGLLQVSMQAAAGVLRKSLRPDALIEEVDGATWVEVDRSARGSDRAADLRALVLSVGGVLSDGQTLRRVVVFTRTERIQRRVIAALHRTVAQTAGEALVKHRRQLRRAANGDFEVWMTEDRPHRDRRRSLVDTMVGHVLVQPLPVWLPKLRLDGRGECSTAGWLSENYLPYRRPASLSGWSMPKSPLLDAVPNS
jgi:hypothetical protein